MSTRMQLYLATDRWQSVVFLVSATLELWLWILNQPSNENHIPRFGICGYSHKLWDLPQTEHKSIHTTHAQQGRAKNNRREKNGDKDSEYVMTACATSLPLWHHSGHEIDPRGCHEETLASFLFCVTTLNCPESMRGRRGWCCCERKESWMVLLHVKALVSAPMPIKTWTEKAGKWARSTQPSTSCWEFSPVSHVVCNWAAPNDYFHNW